MNVLVLNAGSSTLKFQLVQTDQERLAENRDARLARGVIERIGGEAVYTVRGAEGESVRGTAPLRDLRAAIEWVVAWIISADAKTGIGSVAEIEAVGHRVVHGGERFNRSVRVDDDVL